MASTVDRNQVSADAIRERLNCLVEDVRQALINPEIVAAFMRATKSTDEDFTWCKCLSDEKVFGGDFFERFAGQGRSHWHYGGTPSLLTTQNSLMLDLVAHPILAGIETKFVANYGRDWLRHPAAARLAIVVGSRNINGLRFFDLRMVWQVTSSIFIVCGSIGGAFILSCMLLVLRHHSQSRSIFKLTKSTRFYTYCWLGLSQWWLSNLHGHSSGLTSNRSLDLVADARNNEHGGGPVGSCTYKDVIALLTEPPGNMPPYG